MESINPATGNVVDTFEEDGPDTVERALETAWSGFTEWRERPLREREQVLVELAEALEANADSFAETMTTEMGKPRDQAVAEIEKCAWGCRHYAEYARTYLEDETYPSPPATDVRTVSEPIGPVLAVMPWNYPFWQVIRHAAPALAVGNTVVLKHAPEVPGCTKAIEALFTNLDTPDGLLQTLFVDTDTIHETVLPDDRIRAATVTGSARAGGAVAATAGEHLKKTVLELGGSDPFIVLDDANLGAAAKTGAWARMQNGGQSCIAAKRILVDEARYERFRKLFLAEIDGLSVGDPTEEGTDVGPLVRKGHRDALHEQVKASVDAGASLVRGGTVPEGDGAFYPPTVLADVPDGCPAAEEEIFGPVAVLEQVSGVDEAIEKANDTEYGLGASIWTADRDRGRDVAGRIEAGLTFVNEMTKSDPRVPFGGIKQSGYGRELSRAGIEEFVNRKTVWVE